MGHGELAGYQGRVLDKALSQRGDEFPQIPGQLPATRAQRNADALVAMAQDSLDRDGGCTADGCVSRYRLEPHHIQHRVKGGNHHPDNLTTLCWYHHHIVIHGHGYRINTHSPKHRIRFLQPTQPRAP